MSPFRSRRIPGTSGGLVISDAGYSFGATNAVGDTPSKTFTLLNQNGSVVTLGTIDTAGVGLAAPYAVTGGTATTGATIAPGATKTLIVTYSPSAWSTTSNDSIDVVYNASLVSSRAITGATRAATPALLAISDVGYTYGTTNAVGDTPSKTFTITNSGETDATLGTITTAGVGLAAPYTVTGGTAATGGTVTAGGGTKTIIVTFTPTLWGTTSNDSIDVPYATAQTASRAITGASRAFVMTDVTSLRQWLDGDDAGTFTLNGAKVATWADKSGGGFDMTQATDAIRPTVATADLNGKNTVKWVAASLQIAQVSNTVWDVTKKHSIFIVAKCDAVGDTLIYTNARTGPGFMLRWRSNAGTLELRYFDNGGASDVVDAVVVGGTGGYACFIITANNDSVNAGVCKIYQAGSLLATGASATGYGATLDAFIQVGAFVGSNYMDGKIAEMAVFEKVVSATEIAWLTAYSVTKWGV